MNKKIHVDEFNMFNHCPIEELEERIRKDESFLSKGRYPYKNHKEAAFYEGSKNNLDVFKLILELRRGSITEDQFKSEVILDYKV